MKYYSPASYKGEASADRFEERRKGAEILKIRGTDKKPDPPRNLIAQSGARKALVTWNLPAVYFDVTGFRVYKDLESNMYSEIKDPSNTQIEVSLNAGSSPPVTNIFVSCVNAQGIESDKVQTKAQATAEAGAPTDPAPPPGSTYDGTVDDPYKCVEIGTPVEVPEGTKEEIFPQRHWVGMQFGYERPLYMSPETLVSCFVRAKDLVPIWWKPWTWFRRYWVEAGPDGFFANHYKAWRETRDSYKVSRTCPGGTYRAGEVRVRLHNAKSLNFWN